MSSKSEGKNGFAITVDYFLNIGKFKDPTLMESLFAAISEVWTIAMLILILIVVASLILSSVLFHEYRGRSSLAVEMTKYLGLVPRLKVRGSTHALSLLLPGIYRVL